MYIYNWVIIGVMDKIVLADRIAALQESATMALDSRAKALQAEGKVIYNLTAGELTADTPEYITSAVSAKLQHNKYTPPAGIPELRKAIAENARTTYGLNWIKTSNVIVTAGAKPAIYLSLLAIINHGDEVIIPVPAWTSFGHLVKLAGGTVVEVPLTEEFDIDPKAIANKITPRTKAVIVNSPNNPTGATFSKPALSGLAATLRGKDITVISDDIYAKLVYDRNFTPVPTCGFEKLIIINGFSKSQILTGWRIGYCMAGDDVSRAINKLIGHTMGNASLPSQHAALAAMAQGDTPPKAVGDMLKRHLQLVKDALAGTPLKYKKPGGAFYVFLDLRAVTDDSAAWCERLMDETGVALVPGEAFSAPGFARLTYSADSKTLKKALKLIKRFASE